MNETPTTQPPHGPSKEVPTSTSAVGGSAQRTTNWIALGIVAALAFVVAFAVRSTFPPKPPGPPPDKLWLELQQESKKQADRGQYPVAIEAATSAIPLAVSTFGEIHPTVAESCNNLALIYFAAARYAEAEPFHARALDMWMKLGGPQSADAAVGASNYGLTLIQLERFAEARRLLELAISIQQQISGPQSPQTALAINNLAVMYDRMGEHATAQPLHEQALAIRLASRGPASLETAASMSNLAACLREVARDAMQPTPDEAASEAAEGDDSDSQADRDADPTPLLARAAELYGKALAIRQRVLGYDHPTVASTLIGLSALNQLQGDFSTAELQAIECLAIREAKLGPKHIKTAAALHNLAGVRVLEGDLPTARRYFNTAAVIRNKVLGMSHHETLESLDQLIAVLFQQEDFATAEKPCRAALKGRRAAARPSGAAVLAAGNRLVTVLEKTDRADEAKALQKSLPQQAAAADEKLAQIIATETSRIAAAEAASTAPPPAPPVQTEAAEASVNALGPALQQATAPEQPGPSAADKIDTE